jgi:hypothetical protein
MVGKAVTVAVALTVEVTVAEKARVEEIQVKMIKIQMDMITK